MTVSRIKLGPGLAAYASAPVAFPSAWPFASRTFRLFARGHLYAQGVEVHVGPVLHELAVPDPEDVDELPGPMPFTHPLCAAYRSR